MDIWKPHRHPDRHGTHQNSQAGNGKREATSRSVSSFPFPVSVISLIKARDLNTEITAPVPLVDGYQHSGQLFQDARVGQRTRIDRPHVDGADQMGDTLFRPPVITTQQDITTGWSGEVGQHRGAHGVKTSADTGPR